MDRVSVLFNEPKLLKLRERPELNGAYTGFSALQRAEIAEIAFTGEHTGPRGRSFSALQRAEIAEITRVGQDRRKDARFQCSSTSRNC